MLQRDLLEIILNKLKLKSSIEEMGIEDIDNKVARINYEDYFNNVKGNIDIVHVYGRTWTGNNLEYIKQALLHKKCQVRIILLDKESPCIPAYAYLFGRIEEDLKNRIDEVINMWKQLYKDIKEEMKGDLHVYVCKGYQSSCLYRIDDRIINVQHLFNGGRTGIYPTIACKKTESTEDFYHKFIQDIEAICKSATEIPL